MAIPVVTSSTTASAVRFTAFSYQITASGVPTSFAATDLPVGLSVDTGTGLISGSTTVAADTYIFSISATNADGTSPEVEVTLTVSAVAPASFFKRLISGWMENNYLTAILCELRLLTGSGGPPSGGGGTPSVPGGATGVAATPVVVAAGMYAISVNVTAGNVTPSGVGTEFTGAWPIGSYTITSAGPGYVLPEITLTGDGTAAYTVIWTHN